MKTHAFWILRLKNYPKRTNFAKTTENALYELPCNFISRDFVRFGSIQNHLVVLVKKNLDRTKTRCFLSFLLSFFLEVCTYVCMSSIPHRNIPLICRFIKIDLGSMKPSKFVGE